GWIASRTLGLKRATLRELERGGLILPRERRALAAAWRMLARVRLSLHHLAGRAEERLLFDLQPRIAELLGYTARPGALAVERLMQDYYRAATTIARANGLLFDEVQTRPDQLVRLLAPGIVARGKRIDFADAGTTPEHPELIFELLAYWQKHPE